MAPATQKAPPAKIVLPKAEANSNKETEIGHKQTENPNENNANITNTQQNIKSVILEEPVKPEISAIANNDDYPSHDDYIMENEEQFSTIKRSPHSKTNSLQSPDETSSSNATDTAVYQDQFEEEEVVRTKVSTTVQQPQSVMVVKNGSGVGAGSLVLDHNESKL